MVPVDLRRDLGAQAVSGDIAALRTHFAAATNTTESADTNLVRLLADDAARAGQVETWCYLFDTFLRPRGEQIPWSNLQHAARRGDVELGRAFQQRQTGWANAIEPPNIRGHPQTQTVLRLACMRGQLHFVKFMIEECGCDVNHDASGRSLIRMLVCMDLDDGRKSFKFLGLGNNGRANIRSSRAVYGTHQVSR